MFLQFPKFSRDAILSIESRDGWEKNKGEVTYVTFRGAVPLCSTAAIGVERAEVVLYIETQITQYRREVPHFFAEVRHTLAL